MEIDSALESKQKITIPKKLCTDVCFGSSNSSRINSNELARHKELVPRHQLNYPFNPDDKKSFYLKKSQNHLDLEIYNYPSEKDSHTQEALIQNISEITKLAWEDFGEVVQKWFDWASIIILVKLNGKIIGFNASTFEEGKILTLLATFILPEYQTYDVAKVMQYSMIKKFLLERGKRHFLAPFWFTFRTQNPRVMQSAARFNAYPSACGRKPSTEETTIAKHVAKRFSPQCEFDERYFVLKGALKDKPDLLGEDNVFYSRNSTVNNFCDQHLEYSTKAGNLFVVVGRFSWLQKAYFCLKF